MGGHSLLGVSIPHCLSGKEIVATGVSRCIGTAVGRGEAPPRRPLRREPRRAFHAVPVAPVGQSSIPVV
jgi:hypothetical protein